MNPELVPVFENLINKFVAVSDKHPSFLAQDKNLYDSCSDFMNDPINENYPEVVAIENIDAANKDIGAYLEFVKGLKPQDVTDK